MLHEKKKASPKELWRGHDNPKNICSYALNNRFSKYTKKKSDKTEKRNRQSKIKAEILPKCSCNSREQLDKKSIEYRKHKQHYQLTWSNWYL